MLEVNYIYSLMATHRTKKNKHSTKDTKSLWAIFDEEIGDKKMECVYNNVRSIDNCSTCKSALAFTASFNKLS